jgi:hypothetical protein
MIEGNFGLFPVHVNIQIGLVGVTGHSTRKSSFKLAACFFKNLTAGSKVIGHVYCFKNTFALK